MSDFLEALRIQRLDDHRYYHHCRINQSLHLLSAICFIISYVLLFIEPAWAALLAWLVSMTARQSGHFFFEPLGYDHVNQASNEFKEEIKVGYNLRRKMVLLSVWLMLPLVIYFFPGWLDIVPKYQSPIDFLYAVGYAWLLLGIGGLLFRTIHLCFLKDIQTGLVWMAKILTDPFHDVYLYYKAPLYLLRGQRFDQEFLNATPRSADGH